MSSDGKGSVAEAGFLGFDGFLRLIGPLVGADAAAGQSVGRPSAQIDVEVVDVAHDVLVIAKRRHDVLGASDVADLAADATT